MKFKQRLSLIVKIIIIVISYVYVIFTLLKAPDLSELPNIFLSFSIYQFLLFAIVCVLMIVNWSIEAFKWQILIKEVEPLTYLKSIKSVFSGVTVGLATPNRAGEFGGRILFLEKQNRSLGGFLALAGSFSQLAVTLILGLLGFFLLLIAIPQSRDLFAISDVFIIAIGILFAGFILLLYLKIDYFSGKLGKIPLINKMKNLSNYPELWNITKKFKVLALSILRYLVFIHQFYLLVYILGIEIEYANSMLIISVIYLLMAVVPIISIGEPGLRISFSLILFSIFTNQAAAVFTASILLWIINVAIPAIIGSILILNQKKIKYENSTCNNK
jgi:uncharacterized membrane protein YbhN (UPF0104 family)